MDEDFMDVSGLFEDQDDFVDVDMEPMSPPVASTQLTTFSDKYTDSAVFFICRFLYNTSDVRFDPSFPPYMVTGKDGFVNAKQEMKTLAEKSLSSDVAFKLFGPYTKETAIFKRDVEFPWCKYATDSLCTARYTTSNETSYVNQYDEFVASEASPVGEVPPVAEIIGTNNRPSLITFKTRKTLLRFSQRFRLILKHFKEALRDHPHLVSSSGFLIRVCNNRGRTLTSHRIFPSRNWQVSLIYILDKIVDHYNPKRNFSNSEDSEQLIASFMHSFKLHLIVSPFIADSLMNPVFCFPLSDDHLPDETYQEMHEEYAHTFMWVAGPLTLKN